MVSTLGPGYSIISSPEGEELDELPGYLYPLPWSLKHYKLKSVPLIQNDIIKQGNRNNHLFSWSCFMHQNEEIFASTREEVMNILAINFCDPPIYDQQEIFNLIDIENRIERDQSNTSIDNSLEVSVWVDHIFSKWGKTRFRFHNTEQAWYEYSEEAFCWKPISDTMMQFHVCKEFESYKSSNVLRRNTFIH